MEQELMTLKATLTRALAQLSGPLKTELSQSLHMYGMNQLPHKQLSELAAETVDLLHSIEQLLTPAPLTVADHFLGYVDTKCLCAVVQLGIPDELQKGGKTISELSLSCNAHQDRLRQVMRVLSNKGIFSWDPTTQTYSNNATAELLTREHWTQWRNWVDLFGTEFYDIARGIPESLSSTQGADETSYINYIKPLILAQELAISHVIAVIDTREEWFYRVHPERYVPALRDQDPDTHEKVTVFESTACLEYLALRFDPEGTWTGRTVAERGVVLSWTAYQTAGLGPTAKYWLYFLRGYPSRAEPVRLHRVIAK
ncbi:hypothetical protein DV738_g1679, partial [Chaetothyriales sp. CBS 135597]